MKYTLGTKVFDADNLTAAREYAKSMGWVAANVVSGDWITYPGTGRPPAGATPSPKTIPLVTYPSPDPKDYEPGGPWERGEPSPSYTTGTTPPKDTTPTTYTEEQQLDYQNYLDFLKTKEGKTWAWPTPTSIDDYFANVEKWATRVTETQEREFNEWSRYASRYGDVTDWYPNDFENWLANYSTAQEQLQSWKQEHGVAETEQTEYDEYVKEQRAYAEETRVRQEYAAQEAYREQPMYSETFTKWIQGQSDTSQALQAYIKGQYPSLQAEYEAGAGRLTGFPTREEARTEAERRESGWQSWLSQRMPETEQEYYTQRPTERGERLWMQAPAIRTVNW